MLNWDESEVECQYCFGQKYDPYFTGKETQDETSQV